MADDRMISVIIPVYNEEENISQIENELIPVMNNIGNRYEIVIVDDGSTDNTGERIKELTDKYAFIRLRGHEKNMGLGCAIRTGIDGAKGDLLITMEADFTFHPREIPKLLKAFDANKGIDCISAYPSAPEDSSAKVPFYRRILSNAVNLLYSLCLGRRFKSYSPIFRIYKSEAIKGLRLTSKGFTINAEILFNLLMSKKNVVEIPVTFTSRRYGRSKLKFMKEIRNHIVLLGRIVIYRFQPKQ